MILCTRRTGVDMDLTEVNPLAVGRFAFFADLYKLEPRGREICKAASVRPRSAFPRARRNWAFLAWRFCKENPRLEGAARFPMPTRMRRRTQMMQDILRKEAQAVEIGEETEAQGRASSQELRPSAFFSLTDVISSIATNEHADPSCHEHALLTFDENRPVVA